MYQYTHYSSIYLLPYNSPTHSYIYVLIHQIQRMKIIRSNDSGARGVTQWEGNGTHARRGHQSVSFHADANQSPPLSPLPPHIAAPLSRQPPTRAHTHHAPSLPLPPFPAPPPTAAPPPAPLPDRREPPIVLLRQTPTSPHRAASPHPISRQATCVFPFPVARASPSVISSLLTLKRPRRFPAAHRILKPYNH